MIHKQRPFRITQYDNLTALANLMVNRCWTLCTGFAYKAPDGRVLTFLNDAFSEDGAQEYAVLYDGRQVDSWTVSWMKVPALIEHVERLLQRLADGTHDVDMGPCTFVPHEDGFCSRCA